MTAQIGKQPTADELDAAVTLLKLLADRTRLMIVWALLHGEHSVGELAEHVDASSPAVSQHLAKLRLAQLVRTRRVGNHIFYAAVDDHALGLVTEALFHAEHVTSTHPDHHRSDGARAS